MSEAIAFDTHRFVKRLTDCGFTEQQAETLADEHVSLLNSNLATKVDIAAVKANVEAVKADIEGLRLATKADIEALRQETKTSIAAVKADIEALRLATRADIEALRQETGAAIETAKSDLMKWMFGGLIAQGGLIVALIKLL
ncbi:MAG: DUF1640 domain-containing protein [bacterium]|nr:DUF1640 domain-containing protein [bacterium]MDE0240118.1 DUF1640 domain-containing protein [bacterium]MDE0416405.1 DUF1640 domain-containing protein [bacterium]